MVIARRALVTLATIAGVTATPALPSITTGALSVAPAAHAQAATPSIMWGAATKYSDTGWVPTDMTAVTRFESHTGKPVSIIHFSQHWQSSTGFIPFDPTLFSKVRDHGAIPFYTWMSNSQNGAIYNGTYDVYITAWAQAAKQWGHPFFLRLDHEMDGWWYPWGEGQTSVDGPIVNGNQPGDYVKMWRHVHDIFTSVGATNVTWVWCTNHESTTPQYPPLSQLYPGDAYVDWTCMDPYNRYQGSWLTFNQTLTGSGVSWMSDTYHKILQLAPTKPMIIGEFASVEDATDPMRKANWITDALLTQIPQNFPAIKAVLWYNMPNTGYSVTTPIESSANAQAAFASAIKSPVYATNTFASLDTSPIQPLGSSPPTPGPTAISPTNPPAASPVPTTTVSPARTATPVPSGTPIATSTLASGTEEVTNGGLESGQSPWLEHTTPSTQVIGTGATHAGTMAAHLCGVNSCDHELWQVVTLPAGLTKLSLTYWYYIQTKETGASCDDSFRSAIRTTLGTAITVPQKLCNTNGTSGWVKASYDVTSALRSYAGQRVQVYFEGKTNASNPSTFSVDDISLTAT